MMIITQLPFPLRLWALHRVDRSSWDCCGLQAVPQTLSVGYSPTAVRTRHPWHSSLWPPVWYQGTSWSQPETLPHQMYAHVYIYKKVSSYIAQYPILRIAQSALHFTSLADLFFEIRHHLNCSGKQLYAAINARRLLIHLSTTCL